MKTEFPDKWNYLTKKLAYPNEFFNSIDEYQKPVNDFFIKLKNKCPSDKKIERTKEIIRRFKIKNGELTQIFFKGDVLLLTCVFQKFIKVSVNEFGFNPLFCVSLLGYTGHCGLKYTVINLQTLQDKDFFFIIRKNIRGGISSVMGNCYVKLDENSKIIYMDATNFYGHSMIQPLPFDEIDMWYVHQDLYMYKREEFFDTPDDSDTG